VAGSVAGPGGRAGDSYFGAKAAVPNLATWAAGEPGTWDPSSTLPAVRTGQDWSIPTQIGHILAGPGSPELAGIHGEGAWQIAQV